MLKQIYVVYSLFFLMLCGVFACSADGDSAEAYSFQTGPQMLAGQNCLRCHSASGAYPKAPIFSLGGTVYSALDSSKGVSGARISVTDQTGKKIELTSNEAGNFFTTEALKAPYTVRLDYNGKSINMPVDAPAGSCNACHSSESPVGNAKGHIYIPQ